MKKLLTIILIIVLLIPAVALAEQQEVNKYYGYAHIEILKTGEPCMSFLYFADDFTCYYSTQIFRDKEPGLGRAYVGFWSYTKSGDIYAKIGENTSLTLSFSSTGDLVDMVNYAVYEPVNALLD